MQQHPQNPKAFKEIQRKVEEQLAINGTSVSAMKIIANTLGIDTGLVVSIKNTMRHRNSAGLYNEIEEKLIHEATATVPEQEEEKKETVEVVEEESSSSEPKTEEKKERKKKVFLTPDQEQEILEHRDEFTAKELAELYNVSKSKIWSVLHNNDEKKKEEEEEMGKKGKMERTRQRDAEQQKAQTAAASTFVADVSKFGGLHRVFKLDKLSFNIISRDDVETVEAGLIADRHDGIPCNTFIFDGSFGEELMFDYEKQEKIVRDFVTSKFNFSDKLKSKQLKLYVTGMQSAYGSVMKVCINMGINLVTMHYNAKSKTYMPQYINGDVKDIGAHICAFDKLRQQKSLKSPILLFNCTYEDFLEANIERFFIMELSQMRNQSSVENIKDESIIIILKNKEDIWKVYPTVLDGLMENTAINLAIWVSTARIKDNTLQWNMNIIKSFNYK